MTRARVSWFELEFAETDVRDVGRTKCSAVPASVCHHHEDQNNALTANPLSLTDRGNDVKDIG